MKAAAIHDIKTELQTLKSPELVNLCLKLARFKQENKELLTYLLYESNDEAAFVSNVKREMTDSFENMNVSGVYLAQKPLRKILRNNSKYNRFAGSAPVEIELGLHFCSLLAASGLPVREHAVLQNMYQGQIKKIKKSIQTLHEDLQYDYHRMLASVMNI